MTLRLPRIAIDLSGPKPRALVRRRDALRSGELRLLIRYDAEGTAPRVERCIALAGRRWAVGRRADATSVWRIVGQEALERLGHPAWLLTKEWWFDPTVDEMAEGPTPAALPLRNQVRFAVALENPRVVYKALSAVVAAVRRLRGPVALVVSPEAMASASSPARWFALSVITMLPPSLREALRFGVGEAEPDPGLYDLVIATSAPAGFTAIELRDPPGEGDDLVAFFVRNRLMAGELEALETAAFLHDSEDRSGSGPQAGVDAWTEGITRLIRSGVPGLSALGPDTLEKDPESAVRAVAARVRSGAELTSEVLGDLVAVTLKTRDPRPWGALASRPAVERANAVGALLARRTRLRKPRPELIKVLASLYPRGAALDPWCAALLHWIREGTSPEPLVHALGEALEEGRGTVTAAARMSLWQELVQALIEAGHNELATRVLVAPVAGDLARKGAARGLASAWCSIPAAGRDPAQLGPLVAILRQSPDGERAIEQVVRKLRSEHGDLRPMLAGWPAEDVARFAGTLGLDPADSAWEAAEKALNAGVDDPRRRFVRLALLRDGFPGLLDVAEAQVGAAVDATSFPDPELAEIALALAQTPGRSGIWPWLAVSAAAPDRFPPEILEPAVAGVTSEVPETPELLKVAFAAGHRLGAAAVWSGLDHARWIQLLCTGDVPAFEYGLELASAIVQGVASTAAGVERMVEITAALASLGAKEPAARAFVESVLPKAWSVGFPRLYTDRVRRAGLPADVRPLWEQVVGR